jgi:hypothetical protein
MGGWRLSSWYCRTVPIGRLPTICRALPGRGAAAALGPSTLAGPFRTILRDLGLTHNQVWRLTKTDGKWAGALEAALTATSRDDLKHGTTAAYVRGCVCSECREGQRRRMAKTWRNPARKVSQLRLPPSHHRVGDQSGLSSDREPEGYGDERQQRCQPGCPLG